MAGPLNAEQIYEVARAAGFSPDQAVTMTAIALAESGGNPGAHNPHGEDSRGLWQINMNAHSNAPWAQGLDLYNPRDNAIAAWQVSQQGGDISPWTVTHGSRGSPYTDHAAAARQAATSHGEPANGNFNPPAGYGDTVPAGAAGGTPYALPDDWGGASAGGDGSVQRFLEAALAQQGDTYIVNAHTEPTDADPDAFDCSELVEWAAAQAGVDGVAEASFLQYLDMKEAGTTISVEQALNTPGAILFRFPAEPYPGQTERLEGSHVAISLGDGRTMEASNPQDGVGIKENAADRGFNYGALIPGMDYGSATLPPVGQTPTMPPPEPDPLDVALWNADSPDTDVDMLPDHFEIKYGLDPHEADTDGDGITDGYELIVLGTKPDLLDGDFDGIADGLEISLGLDPLVADNPDPAAPLVPPDDLLLDSDGDGIADWGEHLAGTDADNPDTDGDLVLDGDELMAGTDPLGASPFDAG